MGLKDVEKLKFRVYPVLPLVFGDELSYMEMLGKVVKKINEIIEQGAGGEGGGTTVYVDGEAVTTWDANTKSAVLRDGTVLQQYEEPSIPTLKKDGVAVSEIELTTTPASGKGAEYDTNGCLKMATPQNDGDGATKGYVDNAIENIPGGTGRVYMHNVYIMKANAYMISFNMISGRATQLTFNEIAQLLYTKGAILPATGVKSNGAGVTGKEVIVNISGESGSSMSYQYIAADGTLGDATIVSEGTFIDTVFEV